MLLLLISLTVMAVLVGVVSAPILSLIILLLPSAAVVLLLLHGVLGLVLTALGL